MILEHLFRLLEFGTSGTFDLADTVVDPLAEELGRAPADMMAIRPERMLSFSTELQDILGFKVCKGAGHIFGQDPRKEMERHYGPADADDSYLQKRNELHA